MAWNFSAMVLSTISVQLRRWEVKKDRICNFAGARNDHISEADIHLQGD